ncbi:hypothetical protein Harreka1_52 [Olleya phage Harreka_1]|uniref:Uncharacterized protein n=1 Tax=Olleya phage Harreka_1 TaxID=2745673 RepID=A0A8E5EAT7_9CAUD|nr:hypothetical protein M1M26_gp52 [Olleya phage Harreka_1]QQV90459.1 hypothetical protein Harreka1_52 [Olleya phage Harreka_1]
MKKETEKLIEKLVFDTDIEHLHCYDGSDCDYDVYNHITGFYNYNYFVLLVYRKRSVKRIEIVKTSKKPEELKEYLDSLTELKFTIEK